MAKTTPMRLVELIVYKKDIHNVLKYLGKLGDFQFQHDLDKSVSRNFSGDGAEAGNATATVSGSGEFHNPDQEMLEKLKLARANLDLPDLKHYTEPVDLPSSEDYVDGGRMVALVQDLHDREVKVQEDLKHVTETLSEAQAFSNLKVSYADLESLSFLTFRIGKIDEGNFDNLKVALGEKAIVVPLGNDKGRIIVGCSKTSRAFVDGELKKMDFVELKVPEDFKGIPDDVLENLENEKKEKARELEEVHAERKSFAESHGKELQHLLERFSVGAQVYAVESTLESTQYVYRIKGWIPAYETKEVAKSLDEITEKRTCFREYLPSEVASVVNGQEKVPVRLKHGKLVGNFERMILSYGAPLYGSVDPTPFVAIFFTILFGIMFGDAGQGLVFFIVGILMCLKKFKLMGWEKFGPIFVCIGCSSMIMGLLTGEFFTNEEILVPFSRFVTGLFGEPKDHILHLMPTGSSESIMRMFYFFGFTCGVGFLINTVGLLLNIINSFSMRRFGKALFGKNGISGALFFWYVVWFALRVLLLKIGPAWYDWVVLGVSLLLTAFCEPLERLVDGERPVMENGLLACIIAAVVEVIEVVSSYISNSVSFLRVGAFALSHAVLSYIISMMMGIASAPVAVVVSLIGNAIVIVLEGMIVAIQVVRLQYYEFFSKFFSETGREFKPFAFIYS